MQLPVTRLRRLRKSPQLRSLVSETSLSPSQLIAPLFIVPGNKIKKEIKSLPGQYQLSTDIAVEYVKVLSDLGVNTIILFGIPEYKDDTGSSACLDNGIVQNAVRSIKEKCPKTIIATDLCFCEYTSHGHCGILSGEYLDNDETLSMLVKQALSHAKAGADIIAPSGMIDGCISALRSALDKNNHINTALMGYSAKYASSYYGPFRDAVDSAPQFGDRKTYQMNPANAQEALLEVELDISEGADIVMVKPALAYLDIIKSIKQSFKVPLAAYNVSGEYSMIKLASEKGLVDGTRMMHETLLGIKRAGADIIITYFAEEFAKLYNTGNLNDF